MQAVRNQKDVAPAHSERLTTLLIRAAKLGDIRAIETLIAEGANVNGATRGGTTALMMAASFGQLAALRLLHQRGAAINEIRSDGFNPLTLAVFFGHEDVVRELLSRGADIHATSRCGTTVEMWAAMRGFPNIADLLRERREGFSVMAAPTEYAAFDSTSQYQPASGSSQDDDRDFNEGIRKAGQTEWTTTTPAEPTDQHYPAVAGGSFQDDNLDVDEGIRRVGQAEWTTTTRAEPTGQCHPAVARDSFDEGIRRVGQTEWTTTTRPEPTGQYHPAVASDSFDEGIRRVGQTERATTARSELTGQHHPAVAGESFGEGIRRVGQRAWTTTPPGELTGQYHLTVAGGSFSPFSTLSDRLGLSWKHAAVMVVFVVALSGVSTVAVLNRLKHEPQPTSGISSAASEQPSTLKSQSLDKAETQSQRSVNASSEQRPSEPTEPSTLDDSSRAGRVKVAESQGPFIGDANHTVAEPHVAKAVAPYSRITARAPSKNRRQKKAVRPGEVKEESGETNAPAAVTFISKQPAPASRVTAPNFIPAQPATLIEGSSTKKKVIQWP